VAAEPPNLTSSFHSSLPSSCSPSSSQGTTGVEAPATATAWRRWDPSSEHLPPPPTPQIDPRWVPHHPRPHSRPIPSLPWPDSGDPRCWPCPGTQLQKMISS
jgi:hypothetical protein